MSPVSLKTSDSTYVLATGKAKLWMLLVGVNQYQDEQLPPLQYSAFDCQGLSEALTYAAREFPHKQVMMHHDFAAQTPTIETVRTSIKQIVLAAKPQDTLLFYFSGHGVIDTHSHQAYLCLSDTQKSALRETALAVPELLDLLSSCAALRQVVWLDACHSGSLTLRGAKGEGISDDDADPSSKLAQVLRNRAAKSKGFYALVSCDTGQRSWEFPELGHGLFTYCLMRGLRGEAADMQGVIEADGLYKYVYRQTLQYIDETNQQLRLLNQQKLLRGETPLYPEYPPQTPKRIVEGVGELVLGLKPDGVIFQPPQELLRVKPPTSKSSLAATEVVPLNRFLELKSLRLAPVVSKQAAIELNNQGQVLRFPLQKDRHQLGRDRDWSDLDIPAKGWEVLSRHQAVLQKQGDDYYINDGDGHNASRNGIFLNHTRINSASYLLKHGMTLKIGQDPRNLILLTYLNLEKLNSVTEVYN